MLHCVVLTSLLIGFGTRRSRVQIPPSRLFEESALQRVPLRGFLFRGPACCELREFRHLSEPPLTRVLRWPRQSERGTVALPVGLLLAQEGHEGRIGSDVVEEGIALKQRIAGEAAVGRSAQPV